MNVLFLVYWGIHDGLTASTVLPHVRILEENPKVENVFLCTIERDVSLNESRLSPKVWHIPLSTSHSYSAKIRDFTTFPNRIVKLIERFKIRFLICRGTPAGALGYLVHCKTKIEYAVESFEPHADYMRESGVWSPFGLRYIFQRYWEKKQLKTARYIMPVSNHYRDDLISERVDAAKLFVMPCAVDLQMFAFNMDKRISIRKALKIDSHIIIGIYVGKFGGLYYRDEAFQIFNRAREYFKSFHLIVLSPDDKEFIASSLLKAGYLAGSFNIKHVHQSEVPSYLSAADFAFATYKPGYFKRYLSPVKVGEYWAAGLPVLLTDGIGDDHKIISSSKAGAIFDYQSNNVQSAFALLQRMLELGREKNNTRIAAVARRHRNFEQDRLVYKIIIDGFSENVNA